MALGVPIRYARLEGEASVSTDCEVVYVARAGVADGQAEGDTSITLRCDPQGGAVGEVV